MSRSKSKKEEAVAKFHSIAAPGIDVTEFYTRLDEALLNERTALDEACMATKQRRSLPVFTITGSKNDTYCSYPQKIDRLGSFYDIVLRGSTAPAPLGELLGPNICLVRPLGTFRDKMKECWCAMAKQPVCGKERLLITWDMIDFALPQCEYERAQYRARYASNSSTTTSASQGEEVLSADIIQSDGDTTPTTMEDVKPTKFVWFDSTPSPLTRKRSREGDAEDESPQKKQSRTEAGLLNPSIVIPTLFIDHVTQFEAAAKALIDEQHTYCVQEVSQKHLQQEKMRAMLFKIELAPKRDALDLAVTQLKEQLAHETKEWETKSTAMNTQHTTWWNRRKVLKAIDEPSEEEVHEMRTIKLNDDKLCADKVQLAKAFKESQERLQTQITENERALAEADARCQAALQPSAEFTQLLQRVAQWKASNAWVRRICAEAEKMAHTIQLNEDDDAMDIDAGFVMTGGDAL